jgi:phosphotransferase system HPr (HPr) family protein
VEARRTVRVGDRDGFHARSCTAIVLLARRYRSRLTIRRGDEEADGRSVFDLMLLNARHGEAVELVAEGDDAEALVAALATLVEAG